MEKNEAISKALQMLNNSKAAKQSTVKSKVIDESPALDINYEWLPKLEENQFILMIDNIIFCIEEPSWWTAQNIEYESFRKNATDIYFESEYEKREIIRHCLKWVAEPSTHEIINENILERVHQEPIEKLWVSLYSKLKINGAEANDLYNSAKAYYSNSKDFMPIHPIIIELDMMMKFGSLTRQEIRSISMTDMERIKIVLMARAEIMQLTNTIGNIPDRQDKTQETLLEQYKSHPNLFPQGVAPISPPQYMSGG